MAINTLKSENRRNGDIYIEKSKTFSIPDKEPQLRESILTKLLRENLYVKALYKSFWLITIFLVCFSLMKDFNTPTRRIGSGFYLIYQDFRNFHKALLLWVSNNLIMVLTYFSFILWARIRSSLQLTQVRKWDYIWMIIALGYFVVSLTFFPGYINSFEIGIGTSTFLTLESVKYSMKLYSFLRSNVSKATRSSDQKRGVTKLPELSKFAYYMFAPTFIYKDEYPRTPSIRCSFLLEKLLEIIGTTTFLVFFIAEIYRPIFHDLDAQPPNPSDSVSLVFRSCVPGAVLFYAIYFLVIHCLQNLLAEVFRFGDRRFHEDWWGCSDAREFFRRWNHLTGDWLYVYVYKDMYEVVWPGCKKAALATTFLVSSVLHEVVAVAILGYFYPIISAMYLVIVLLVFPVQLPNNLATNVFFMTCVCFSFGCLISLNIIEYSARKFHVGY